MPRALRDDRLQIPQQIALSRGVLAPDVKGPDAERCQDPEEHASERDARSDKSVTQFFLLAGFGLTSSRNSEASTRTRIRPGCSYRVSLPSASHRSIERLLTPPAMAAAGIESSLSLMAAL